MHGFEIKPELYKKLLKISKKDKKAYEAIINKIQEIISCVDVEHYKNLRYDMKISKRVHIGHFVLVTINKKILFRLSIMTTITEYTRSKPFF